MDKGLLYRLWGWVTRPKGLIEHPEHKELGVVNGKVFDYYRQTATGGWKPYGGTTQLPSHAPHVR
jgi:hypothetical protein